MFRNRIANLAQRFWGVLRDDRGSVTAEFAMMLPVMGAVIALCVTAIGLSAQQLRLTAVAADVARAEARGENMTAQLVTSAGYPVTVHRSEVGGVRCVQLSAIPGRGIFAAVTLSARSCALVSSPQ